MPQLFIFTPSAEEFNNDNDNDNILFDHDIQIYTTDLQ